MNDNNAPSSDEFDLAGLHSARAASVNIDAPDFSTVLTRSQRRVRRRATLTASAVVVVGVGGLFNLVDSNDVSPSSADAPIERETANEFTPIGTSVADSTFGCVGPIDGPDPEVQYFTHCWIESGSTPAPVPTTTTFDVQTTTIAPPRTTTPPAPAQPETATTTTVLCAITSTEYVVQAGDFPLGVANRFQVDLTQLLAANGWDDASDFGFPGETITVPVVNC